MQQLSLFLILIAFVPRLAVAQPVLSTHPPVHTIGTVERWFYLCRNARLP